MERKKTLQEEITQMEGRKVNPLNEIKTVSGNYTDMKSGPGGVDQQKENKKKGERKKENEVVPGRSASSFYYVH